MRHAHIVGAGLAGLAAALTLADAGWRVFLYEAAPAAGGRCRSYFDRELGCRIDNGNHLLLSGNRAAMTYLSRTGAAGTMTGPGKPLFPFIELPAGQRWTLRPSEGRLPWWIFSARRRVPQTKVADYLALLALRRAGPEDSVAAVLGHGRLWHRLMEPLVQQAIESVQHERPKRVTGGANDILMPVQHISLR